MTILRRLLLMALLGALGAFLGAAAGEGLFLGAPKAPGEPSGDPESRHVCLVFDLSESMRKRTAEGISQIEALRNAAHAFLSERGFERDSISLVGFSDDAQLVAPPSRSEVVRATLDGLHAGGRTDIASGLDLARDVLGPAGHEERWVLLFTDGKPQTGRVTDPVADTLLAAQACRDAGVRIVAVGTGLADRALLEQVTGDPASVFVSAPESLGSAFKSSGERIRNRQMLASTPAAIDLELSLKRACAWAALIAFGAGLALVSGTNTHLHRRSSKLAQLALVLVGSAASGLVAGAVGQGTFYALSGFGAFEPVLRTLSWLLLGSGVVFGMSFFVPNLPRGRALFGGALGGAAAVASFLAIVPQLGDTPGRLLGALILGFMAGAMTVLVEASVRKAWLVVHWPGDETSTLLLGATPIVVGHSASAHICPSFDENKEPVIATFTLGKDGLLFEDKRARKTRRLQGGERLRFDSVVVEVHAETRAEHAADEPAPRPSAGLDTPHDPPAPKAALPRRGETRASR